MFSEFFYKLFRLLIHYPVPRMRINSNSIFLRHKKSILSSSLASVLAIPVSSALAVDDVPLMFESSSVTKSFDDGIIDFSDRFGHEAYIDGDRLAISEVYLRPGYPQSISSGVVYIYDRNSVGEWIETAQIYRRETGYNGQERISQFGKGLILQGDRLLISTGNGGNDDQPVAFVYELVPGEGWVETARLTPDVEAGSYSSFANSLQMQGDTIVIGAAGEPSIPEERYEYRGTAYVFERDASSGEWIKTAKLDRDAFGGHVDLFGRSVVLEGDTIFVGAPSSETSLAENGGRVFSYRKSPEGEWLADQEIFYTSGQRSYFFGNKMFADNGVLAINVATTGTYETLFTFAEVDGSWTEKESLLPVIGSLGYSDYFLNERLLLVNNSGTYNSARERVNDIKAYYQTNAGTWELIERFDVSDYSAENYNHLYLGNAENDGRFVAHSYGNGTIYLFDVNIDDTDGDGEIDVLDNCPATQNPDQLNSDDDILGNSCDADDDNDGVVDNEDAFPLDSSEQLDTDGDLIGNNADTDDDGDNAPDSSDAFPLDSSEQLDTDGDLIGNNADTDDDGDGQSDVDEMACDSDPLNAESTSPDSNGDGVPDCLAPTDPIESANAALSEALTGGSLSFGAYNRFSVSLKKVADYLADGRNDKAEKEIQKFLKNADKKNSGLSPELQAELHELLEPLLS